MIKTTAGEIWHITNDTLPERKELLQFFLNGHIHDIIACHIDGKVLHISYYDVLYSREYQENYVDFDSSLFYKAGRMLENFPEHSGKIPVMNKDGDYVCILEYEQSLYKHFYGNKGTVDASVLQSYTCICLYGVNEFSFEICSKCLNNWNGTLVLCGEEWNDFLTLLPDFSGQVRLLPDCEPESEEICRVTEGCNTMHIQAFMSNVDGYMDRVRKGLFSYDDVMPLLFCFSNEQELGTENSDRKFFVIDGDFCFAGLMSIKHKLLTGAAYVQNKGYIPLFQITSSDKSIYSDEPNEDIWSKFFNQPTEYYPEDIEHSRSVTYSPNFNITYPCMYLMQQMTGNASIQFQNNLFNEKLQRYIKTRLQTILPEPQKTLGILIRGTDYIKSKPPGHPIQADVETVIRKIYELEQIWGSYKYLFLSTEDAAILGRMKQEFKERLLYTNQKRFSLKEGEFLYHQKSVHGEGDGYTKGAEYLCTLTLLSQCDSFVASGRCAGTAEAINMNQNRFRHQYVFELGVYP